MRQRGRKSAAALTAVTPLFGRAPAIVAPSTLTAAERAVWQRTMDRAPRGWFAPEQVDLLALYCGHVAEAHRLRQAARDEGATIEVFAKLTAMAQRESALALAYGRAMRLTVQSRVQAITAGRRATMAPQRGIEALFEREDGDG